MVNGTDPRTRPTLGALVSAASRDLATLLHDEVALAKAEVRQAIKSAGSGAALFAAAAFLLLMFIVLLSIAAASALVQAGLDPWAAFLIVAGVYLLLALVLGGVGYLQVRKVRGPTGAVAEATLTKEALADAVGGAAGSDPSPVVIRQAG
jgi:hypothetical protein